MNTALVSSIIRNINSLADLPPGLDNRTHAIRRYIGTIWELIVPDCSKADDGWYQSLLRHAETMVVAFEHSNDCSKLSDQADRMFRENSIFGSCEEFLRVLEGRRRLASSIGHGAEYALASLLHLILECGGDASKVPPPEVIDGDAPQRKRDTEERRKMFR
jgi:hypothetical protein